MADLTSMAFSFDVVTAALQSFMGALGQIGKVVAAFNPFVVEQFNLALEGISATIGAALEPVMQAALDVARQVNDVIAPLMADLAPLIEEVADQFARALLPVIQALVET